MVRYGLNGITCLVGDDVGGVEVITVDMVCGSLSRIV